MCDGVVADDVDGWLDDDGYDDCGCADDCEAEFEVVWICLF